MARILVLTPQLPVPPQALTGFSQGTTIRNFNLMAGLARRHTLDLLTFLPADADLAPDPCSLLRPYCQQVSAEPPPVRALWQRGRDTLLSHLPDMALRLDSPALHGHMARLMQKQHYDVIQVEGIEMAPYALARSRPDPNRPRLVFDDHNAEYLLQKRTFLTDIRRPRRWPAAAYSFIQWRKLIGYERRICRAADRVIAVSEADREALQCLAPGLDVAVIPNGVDLDFFRPDATPAAPDLGPHALVFVGKMDYRPNVDAVLWFVEVVLPLLLAQAPTAHFYAVGQQPHARLAALAGHPAVTITGRVPDVRPFVAAARVFVVPLRIGGGTRLKVLEAMAMGRPIVSTRLGCDGFHFEDGREVLFADEPRAFADAVLAVLRDPGRGDDLGQAGRDHVEAHYGWDAIVPRLESLYG